jgi:hypothetical protein
MPGRFPSRWMTDYAWRKKARGMALDHEGALEREIEERVCRLYGPAPGEIKIVEEAGR